MFISDHSCDDTCKCDRLWRLPPPSALWPLNTSDSIVESSALKSVLRPILLLFPKPPAPIRSDRRLMVLGPGCLCLVGSKGLIGLLCPGGLDRLWPGEGLGLRFLGLLLSFVSFCGFGEGVVVITPWSSGGQMISIVAFVSTLSTFSVKQILKSWKPQTKRYTKKGSR